MIALKPGAGSLTQRLHAAIKAEILRGRLAAGSRLLSTRALAAELGISRNTVNAAYALLEAQGFILTSPSSGSRVARGASRPRPEAGRKAARPMIGFPPERHDLIDFKSGLPEASGFPVRRWLSVMGAALASAPPSAFAYGQPEGRPELRAAIAEYAARYRDAACSPDQVIVTAGTTQAINILGRVLIGPGRRTALVEDPLTSDIKDILAAWGASIRGLEVDEAGLDALSIPRGLRPALVYTTPSHQFPTGVSMPIQRRLALLEYAAERGCVVVEDDYDSEFRYSGHPLPCLQGLDPSRVAYIGTFSKTLSPALRAGYLIVPEFLVDAARRAKWQSDLHNPVPDQLALARFMREGHLARHVARMKRLYARRRRALAAALEEEAGRAGLVIRILGAEAGIHLCARFPGLDFNDKAMAALERAGVRAYPARVHALEPSRWSDALILGYGSLDEDELARGARIIARAARSLARARPPALP